MSEAPVQRFSHTQGRSFEVFLTALLLPVFAVPIVLLRLWTSKYLLRKWHVDDSLAAVATIFAVFQSIIVCIEARLGGGDHLLNLTLADVVLLLQVGRWGGVPLYNLTTVLVKATILALYLRFAVDHVLRICIYLVLFVVAAYSLVNAIATFALDCSNPTSCNRLFVIYITCAAFNVATDFVILFLPFWLLRPMNISLGRKIAIALVLMAGGLYVAPHDYYDAQSISLVLFNQVNSEPDTTYAWGDSVKWSLIESWAGLVCACLPCLKAFFTRYFPRLPLWKSSREDRSQIQMASVAT